MPMREIEIKARVTDKASLVSKLKEQGIELGQPISQHDIVYGWPGAADNAKDSVWLRLRTENETRHVFTLKKSVVGHLDSIEHETEVEDSEELIAIFKELGYELYSDLTKIRRKGIVGKIEICLDEVPGLGVFIEAEMIQAKDSDHDLVVTQLWQFFDSLGIDKKDEVFEGYDVLERRSRGL